jgi:hypothetical protein
METKLKIRVNNIECRFSQSRYEIVKWQPNHYYGQREEYLANGWRFEAGWMTRDNVSVQASTFDMPETCYTIATLHHDTDEMCCDMKTVGTRLLDLNENDRNDFFIVYGLAEQKIKENESK